MGCAYAATWISAAEGRDLAHDVWANCFAQTVHDAIDKAHGDAPGMTVIWVELVP